MNPEINIDTTVHKLEDFDFKQHSSFCLLSARKTGKSYLIRNLIYLLFKQKKISQIYIFSRTAHVDPFYLSWVSPEYIFPLESIEKAVALISRVQETNIKNKKPVENVCCLFDDIDVTARASSELEQLFTLGRHFICLSNSGVSSAIHNNIHLCV